MPIANKGPSPKRGGFALRLDVLTKVKLKQGELLGRLVLVILLLLWLAS